MDSQSTIMIVGWCFQYGQNFSFFVFYLLIDLLNSLHCIKCNCIEIYASILTAMAMQSMLLNPLLIH